MKDIDLVIPWVDGSDPAWQSQRNRYLKYKGTNDGFYRDNGLMRYWFRCVDRNMPWIRHIFFITWGHTPEWLDTKHPRLRIINHRDYLPHEFLPTFNSNTLSLNLHRIEGLSEHFIYAEDDIFFVGRQSPEDYFSEAGLPRDFLWLRPITEQFDGDYAHIMLNNLMFINRHFDINDTVSDAENLFYSNEYPKTVIDDNRKYQSLARFPGFRETHLAYACLKSSYDALWEMDAMPLYTTSMHKFRSITDLNLGLVRDYQLVKGRFEPFYPKGRYFRDTASPDLEGLILDENTSTLCINESKQGECCHSRMASISSCFEKRFPEPSSFETIIKRQV